MDAKSLGMIRIEHYLLKHSRLRVAIIVIAFVLASVTLFTGIGIFALTFGPKAIGSYMRDRIVAGSLVALSLLINIAATFMRRDERSFASHYLRNFVLAAVGAIGIFVVVIARALIAHGQ